MIDDVDKFFKSKEYLQAKAEKEKKALEFFGEVF